MNTAARTPVAPPTPPASSTRERRVASASDEAGALLPPTVASQGAVASVPNWNVDASQFGTAGGSDVRRWNGSDPTMKHLTGLARCSVAFALLLAVAAGCAPAGSGARMEEDPCATAHDCGGCAALPGCGWCAGTRQCLSGNASAAVGGACASGWTTDRAQCVASTPAPTSPTGPGTPTGGCRLGTCASTTITGPNGSALDIPSGAATTPADFVIEVRDSFNPPLPEDVTPRGPVFSFSPETYVFASAVTVQVPFAGETDGDLTLYSVNAAGVWAPVTGAVVVGSAMRAAVTRLGLFVVGVPNNAWRDVTGALPTSQPVRDFAFVGARVLAATGRGVYRSDDGGTTWVASTAGLPNNTATYRFAQLDTQLFVATDRGVYRSADNGASWTVASNGLPMQGSNPAAVQALAVHHAQVFAGGEGFVMASSDGGQTWVARQRNLPVRFAPFVLFSRGDTLFAGTYGAGLWSSADDGATWMHADFGDESVYDMARLGEFLFGATAVGVQQYTAGAVCSVLDSAVPDRTPVVLSVAATGTRLYAALGSVGVHFSTNNGLTWTPAREGLPHAASGEYNEVRVLRSNGASAFAVVSTGSSFAVFRTAVR